MKERFRFSEQEVGHTIWTIVQLFYRSLLVFREQHEQYERRVTEFARERNTTREDLRLNSRDLATLLDFKSLERLRNGYLFKLKDLCHSVFRGQDQTDLLDRYVSDIFHQISILKEEHYNVKIYAPLFEKDSREQELRGILDEAHISFPKLTQHVFFLFEQARARMEDLLSSFCDKAVFIRSLYLHRHDFVQEVYPGGIADMYRRMYPLGAAQGFYEVGRSFLHSGFFEQAREAFLLAKAAFRSGIITGDTRAGTDDRRELGTLLMSIDVKLHRLASLESAADGAAPGAEASAPAGVRSEVLGTGAR